MLEDFTFPAGCVGSLYTRTCCIMSAAWMLENGTDSEIQSRPASVCPIVRSVAMWINDVTIKNQSERGAWIRANSARVLGTVQYTDRNIKIMAQYGDVHDAWSASAVMPSVEDPFELFEELIHE